MTAPTAYMSMAEFVDLGLLQEVNRLFFHPRGLALEVGSTGDQSTLDAGMDYHDEPDSASRRAAFVVRVWDAYADGVMAYADGVIDEAKADRVAALVRNVPQPTPRETETSATDSPTPQPNPHQTGPRT